MEKSVPRLQLWENSITGRSLQFYAGDPPTSVGIPRGGVCGEPAWEFAGWPSLPHPLTLWNVLSQCWVPWLQVNLAMQAAMVCLGCQWLASAAHDNTLAVLSEKARHSELAQRESEIRGSHQPWRQGLEGRGRDFRSPYRMASWFLVQTYQPCPWVTPQWLMLCYVRLCGYSPHCFLLTSSATLAMAWVLSELSLPGQKSPPKLAPGTRISDQDTELVRKIGEKNWLDQEINWIHHQQQESVLSCTFLRLLHLYYLRENIVSPRYMAKGNAYTHAPEHP